MTDTPPQRDFFISYATPDEVWAEWVAWILEENSYTVHLQAWDFTPGRNFVLEMSEGATGCDRTIAILSDNYLNANFTQAEWAAAFRQDPQSQEGLLLPIRVGDCKPSGLLSQIIYIDIVGKPEAEAERTILENVAAVIKKRAKPDRRPPFPKAPPPADQRSLPNKVNFPGMVQTPNPFIPLTGAVENPEQFFNGEPTLSRIFELLNSGSSVALIGDRNLGKSSILRAVHRQAAQRLQTPRQTVLINLTRIYSEDDFYAALCKAIDIEPCSGRELDQALDAKRLLLLLDEVERISQQEFSRRVREQLRGSAEGSDAPLKLVVAASTPLKQLFPDSHEAGMVSPFEDVCIEEYLQPWSSKGMRDFIATRLANTSVTFSENEITEFITAAEGKPKQLMRLCNERFRDKLNP
ncbi:hypothetical protein C8255_07790 [filamentous cyanobacterium CCP3]|nr:hypothetical protein C8255_07790 [filamentous cyanobacterium CCP3]